MVSEYTPLEQWLYDTGIAMPGAVEEVARRIEASDWLAAHDAEVREAERERAALHAEEGYRMGEHCDDIAKRIRSGEPAEITARPVVAEEPDWEYGVRRRHGADVYPDEHTARWWVGRKGQDGERQWLVRRRPGTAPGEWERMPVEPGAE